MDSDVLVIEDGIIVGVRERTNEELSKYVLGGELEGRSIDRGLAELVLNTLKVVFWEGVEAERDRARSEEELGMEVEIVNPYKGVGNV